MSNTGLVRKPLLFGIAVLAATLVFVLLTRDSDVEPWSPRSADSADVSALETVEFNPLNAIIPVRGCGEIEFVNGYGLSPPDEHDRRLEAAVGYFLVSDVVPESPGPEVLTTIFCSGPGTGGHGSNAVYVFAGDSEEADRLGEWIKGTLERANEDSGVLTALGVLQERDPTCCPSQYRVSEHHWDGRQWTESKVEYWTLDGQVLEHPLP